MQDDVIAELAGVAGLDGGGAPVDHAAVAVSRRPRPLRIGDLGVGDGHLPVALDDAADQLDRLVASSLINVLRVERMPQFPSVVTFMMLLNVASSTVSPARLGHNIAEATDPLCWWRCVHPSSVAPACDTEPSRVAMRRPAPAPDLPGDWEVQSSGRPSKGDPDRRQFRHLDDRDAQRRRGPGIEPSAIHAGHRQMGRVQSAPASAMRCLLTGGRADFLIDLIAKR